MQKFLLIMKSQTTLRIKDWADEDKPREKLLAKGKKELSDTELLAILLGSGSIGQSAVELAKSILEEHGNSLTALSQADIHALKKAKGVGDAKAVTMLAALELGRRMRDERDSNQVAVIRNSNDLFDCIGPNLVDVPHEEFWAVYLNIKKRVVGKVRISSGGISDTTVDLRLIFKGAIEKNAVCLAVAHNHPSGILTPSNNDIELTQRIKKAGEILHIKLIDHLIVGILPNCKSDYYSFSENGRL